MKISLGVVLALCLAGLQFVAVSIVVLSSYVTSEHALLTHARNLLSDAGTNTIEHSKGFLQPAQGAAELATRLAENRIVASDNFDLLEKFLFQQLQVTPQFAGLYYGDKAGNFVYVKKDEALAPFLSKIISHPDGNRLTELLWRNGDYEVVETQIDEADFYDPRSRLWYQDAQVALETIWTDPYIFFTSQQPGITVASPVFAENGNLQGVVGVDIEIDSISSFLSHLKIGESGKALILNENGDVIAHPNQDLLKKRKGDGTFRFSKIDDIDDALARAAFEGLKTEQLAGIKQEVTSGFVFEGARYVSTTMPVMSDELPWTIAMYAPEADFTGEIRRNRTQNIWIAAVIAFLSGVAGLGLAKFIHKPVRAFAVRSALISQGEISENEPAPATYRELEKVNDTLVHEIAQRKKTEQEYGRTFDLASRAMVQIDTNSGKFLRANAAFSDMLGYSVDEILTRNVCDVTLSSDGDQTFGFLEKPCAAMSRNQETRLRRKNGDTVWVDANAILIRDARGNPLHAVVTMDDLTESRSKEVEIQTLNRDLSHSSRVNTMGYMATSLAHELNQPLTAITQNMDAAILSLQQNPDDPKIKEILEETDQQAHRAGEIIRALREFVLKDEVKKSYFDFEELLRQSLQLVHAEAKLHGTTIETSFDQLPPIFGSRIQVAQVLVNLIRNSIEAIVQSNTNFRLITVHARKTDQGLVIGVEDSGPGFQGGFDPFDKFETNKRDGMGLGLSICKTIVEAHGGTLWYETEDQKPRFCFTLMDEDTSYDMKRAPKELEAVPNAET